MFFTNGKYPEFESHMRNTLGDYYVAAQTILSGVSELPLP
jgi:hypothetical protein